MGRMKGVLSVAHSKQKFVYQAVHMIFNGSFDEEWGSEPRCNKLVFIGKNLDHTELKASFEKCLATPENIAKKVENLRFKVGAKVECKRGPKPTDWFPGTIV